MYWVRTIRRNAESPFLALLSWGDGPARSSAAPAKPEPRDMSVPTPIHNRYRSRGGGKGQKPVYRAGPDRPIRGRPMTGRASWRSAASGLGLRRRDTPYKTRRHKGTRPERPLPYTPGSVGWAAPRSESSQARKTRPKRYYFDCPEDPRTIFAKRKSPPEPLPPPYSPKPP